MGTLTAQPVPPQWPEQVRRPGTPEWERSAVAWLLDQVPGEWRAYEVLRRHPTLLARLAAGQVAASLEAARAGWRTLRRDFGRDLPPQVVEEALRGRTWIPGAGRWTGPPGTPPPDRWSPRR